MQKKKTIASMPTAFYAQERRNAADESGAAPARKDTDKTLINRHLAELVNDMQRARILTGGVPQNLGFNVAALMAEAMKQ